MMSSAHFLFLYSFLDFFYMTAHGTAHGLEPDGNGYRLFLLHVTNERIVR